MTCHRTLMLMLITAIVCVAGPGVVSADVLGIDVSHWQGTIDWTDVHNANYKFAFVKATEGTSFLDSNFDTNMNNAKAAGEVVENDIVRRRMPMLHRCECSATAGAATSWLDGGAGEDDANAGCANMKEEVET